MHCFFRRTAVSPKWDTHLVCKVRPSFFFAFAINHRLNHLCCSSWEMYVLISVKYNTCSEFEYKYPIIATLRNYAATYVEL